MAERTALSPRSIPERDLPKEIGERVILPDGTEYTISGIIGGAKLIHTVEGTGRLFVYWHNPQDPSFVIANGGNEGFPHVFVVRRQLAHVIDRYRGQIIDISQGQWLIEESEEPPATIAELLQELSALKERREAIENVPEQYLISGEQQLLNQWINGLHDISLELTDTQNLGRLSRAREKAQELTVGPLSRATNIYKRNAHRAITEGLEGDRVALLRAAMQAQVELLSRSQDIIGKASGSMNRLKDLDSTQVYWNGIVERLPTSLSHITDVLKPTYLEARRRSAMNFFLNSQAGAISVLNELKAEPYYKKAQEFIGALQPIKSLWEAQNIEEINSIIDEQTRKTQDWWKLEIKPFIEGIPFAQYG